jgi:hypothetical protein
MRGHPPVLPEASKLLPLVGTTTYDKIGAQYGVTRQAVSQRLDTYCQKQFGFGIKEYRKKLKTG